jgi:hypothetical protein
MAKHKKTVGSGITKREVISYSGEDMYAAVKAFLRQWNAARIEGGGSFGAVVLNAERACRSILALAGPPPFEADSPEDYARRILRRIEITKGQIARADADEAARTAVQIGRLCTEAYMKGVWEKHALRGEANASVLKAAAARGNKKKQDRAKPRHATWQAIADEMPGWQDKSLSASAAAEKIANETGDKPDTIRRKIKRK